MFLAFLYFGLMHARINNKLEREIKACKKRLAPHFTREFYSEPIQQHLHFIIMIPIQECGEKLAFKSQKHVVYAYRPFINITCFMALERINHGL